jgi:hypothetical protein
MASLRVKPIKELLEVIPTEPHEVAIKFPSSTSTISDGYGSSGIDIDTKPGSSGFKNLNMDAFREYFQIFIKIVMVILILYILFLIILAGASLSKSSPTIITKIQSMKKTDAFSEAKLPLSKPGEGLCWSFISWFNIDDWNYRYGQKKNIIDWGKNCTMYFDNKTNNIIIEITTFPLINGKINVERCVVKNIPTQRWFCLIVAMDNRNLDVFIDGELVANKFLPYVPYYIPERLQIFKDGGVSGKCGWMQYLSYKIQPFAIEHFQNLSQKFNKKSPLYFLHNRYFFTVLFGIKTFINTMIIMMDRIFKLANAFGIGFIHTMIAYIRQTLANMYDYTSRLM